MSKAQILEFSDYVDGLLEAAMRLRLDLGQTIRLVLPKAAARLGAKAASIRTRDEDWHEKTFAWGKAHAAGDKTVSRHLVVAGEDIGSASFVFAKGKLPEEAPALVRAFCEEFDGILWTIQAARLKQTLVEELTRALTRRVFSEAVDAGVAALAKAVPIDRMAVIHLGEHELNRRSVRYRLYRGARCTHASGGRRHAGLEKAIEADGVALISPDRHGVARALGFVRTVETLLIMGVGDTDCLGQLVVSTPKGLDSLSRDLLSIFANAISQRLTDYRREQAHLAKSFNAAAVDKLLADSDYRRRYLSPRLSDIAIMYADINSFTRICETALIEPERIGRFIDHWAMEAVRIVMRHGGVYDKMVGDCIIGLFGPPFFKNTAKANVAAALAASKELQTFTRSLESQPEYKDLARKAGIPGLGVAVGINLCPSVVGLFGAMQDYTAFSSGMNQTARLQSLGKFRETLLMDTAMAALGKKHGQFDGPHSSEVKNVGKPLRYYRLLNAG